MKIETLQENKFLKMYDVQYKEGAHYFVASRRNKENLVAALSDSEFDNMIADAVTCFVILVKKSEDISEPDNVRLLMQYEYRYPVGRYLLSVPAGLVDDIGDRDEVLKETAIREVKEETALNAAGARIKILSPGVFSSPGMTDETNALISLVVSVDEMPKLNNDGAVGDELFNGFRLITRKEAKEILRNGVDEYGNMLPLQSWAALMYFDSYKWML